MRVKDRRQKGFTYIYISKQGRPRYYLFSQPLVKQKSFQTTEGKEEQERVAGIPSLSLLFLLPHEQVGMRSLPSSFGCTARFKRNGI